MFKSGSWVDAFLPVEMAGAKDSLLSVKLECYPRADQG